MDRLAAARRALWGAALLVEALLGCASRPSEEQVRAHYQPRVTEAYFRGYRWREALPWCTDSEAPPDMLRVEGRLSRSSLRCTEVLCIPDVCCNECEGPVWIFPAAGRPVELRLPERAPLRDNFLPQPSRPCIAQGWMQGAGVRWLRVRMTWGPTARTPAELCRLPDAP